MNYMTKPLELGLWEIAVLSMLQEEPMHPYRMQRLLHERHKDEMLVLKRGSLYHAIRRLLRWKLIEVAGKQRDGRRPERTAYRMTRDGKHELLRALHRTLGTPRREPSEFMAALSFLVYLDAKDATARLEERERWLGGAIREHSAGLKSVARHVGRIHLIESEYLIAMQKAERTWVREIIRDLRSGRLRWDLAEILKVLRASRRTAKA